MGQTTGAAARTCLVSTTNDPHRSPPADLLIVAGRALLPGGERAAVIELRDGRIAAIHAPGDALPAARATTELAADEVLTPALVDTHVHGNDPGRADWEGLASLTAAAAAGGIGTLIDMPLNCVPATTDPAAAQAKRDACPQPAVDVGMWGGAVPENLTELPALLGAGVFGLKAFMLDSGVVEFAALPGDDQLRRAMQAVARAGVPLLVHAEDAEEVAAAALPGPERYLELVASRPVVTEVRAIERLAALAAETGAHVHVVHVTSAEGVATIARAQAAGTNLTGETCPHYLALEAGQIPDGDARFKCFPPIRERRHQDALWAGLAAGTLSLVASDHSPAPWSLKHTGDLRTAWGGIASLQLSLPVTWTAARTRGVALSSVIAWMATAPARLAGLPSKGQIAVGGDADLVAFAPEASFVVDPEALLHRHKETPYAGHELFGVVRRSWLHGQLVDPAAPRGRWLTPPRAAATGATASTATAAAGAQAASNPNSTSTPA